MTDKRGGGELAGLRLRRHGNRKPPDLEQITTLGCRPTRRPSFCNKSHSPTLSSLGQSNDERAVDPRGNRRHPQTGATRDLSRKPAASLDQASAPPDGLLLLRPLIKELVLNLLVDADHPALGAERTILEMINLRLKLDGAILSLAKL